VTEALAADWQIWLAEELLSGAAEDDLIAAMVEAGIDAARARKAFTDLAHSPILIAAQRALTPSRRLLEYRRLAAQSSPIPRIEFPGVEAFFADFYAWHRPVVFAGFAVRWPALNWTPDKLAKAHGSTEVQVCAGRADDPRADAHFEALSHPMALAEYVERLLAESPTDDLYMIARNGNLQRPELAPLLDDLAFPDGLMRRRGRALDACLWFGPEGTQTVLHHDRNNILFCQIFGRKTVELIDPAEPGLLPFHGQVYAPLDRRQQSAQSVVLEPGDALFIPVGWWHRVRAESISISVSTAHFARDNQDVF
jgi:hypothetical protein